jgi:hypothetical protein
MEVDETKPSSLLGLKLQSKVEQSGRYINDEKRL